MSKTKQESPAEGWLRRTLYPGQQVLLIERHATAQASVFAMYHRGTLSPGGGPVSIDWAVSEVARFKRSSRYDGIIVRGLPGTHARASYLIRALGERLYPQGFPCLGHSRCLSREHWGEDEDDYSHLRHHADAAHALTWRLL